MITTIAKPTGHVTAASHRAVSGRYRGSGGRFEVELRVDVDGPRPTMRVSADYFKKQGAKTTYVGSMRVDEPAISASPGETRITGNAFFSAGAARQHVTVTIPRVAAREPPAPASLRHDAAGGPRGSTYLCAFESPSFRTVQLEEGRERGVIAFESYDTASLASAGPPRALTPVAAFAEAGIEAVLAREPTLVDTAATGANAAWSDAELHAAMERSFSRWGDDPQWAVWLLHAVLHDDPDIFGLMFDRKGPQRQGCAVFYGDLTPSTAENSRELLHVCMHELGHAFNLPHCWQRSLHRPSFPSRPDAASWMNYPERYPGGPDAYWAAFAFRFDDAEIVHLRHAFRDNVIMGGAPFGGSAARDRGEPWDAERRDPGLKLTLLAPAELVQGVPVTVGLELAATTPDGHSVPSVLGPRPGTVDIAIRNPRGEERLFEPLLHHCRRANNVILRPGGRPARDFAFIHYGKHGFAFADPGLYRLRARYTADDGAVALSDETTIRIARPVTADQRDVARLVHRNDDVGKLLSLAGSDARALSEGNRTLRTIIRRFPRNPVADIARIVQAASLARGFKRLEPDGSVVLDMAADVPAAAALVGGLIVVEPPMQRPPADRRLAGPAEPPPEVRTRPGVAPAVTAFTESRLNDLGRALDDSGRRARAAGTVRWPPIFLASTIGGSRSHA